MADCHRSWRTGITWGEIEGQIAPGDYASLRALCEGDPGEDAAVVGDDFDPYSDGSWPGHPNREMVDWVPDEIARAFGAVGESFTTGPCLTLDPRREIEIVAGLERRGYACTRDDLIVRRACGYGS